MIKGLINLLFPQVKACMLCNRSYQEQPLQSRRLRMLCPACNQHISYIKEPICSCCGRELSSVDSKLCGDCSKRRHTYFIANRSAVRYSPIMRDWIYTYKFHGREHLVVGLVDLLVHTYNTHYRHLPFEAITYIPLHRDRLYERRFNQAEQLAEGIAKKIGLPLQPTLIRTRDTLKQSHMTRSERLSSLHGAFQAIEGVSSGKTILLVDDIYTTGSTLNEAAMMLKRHGWEQVYTITVARA